MNPRYTVTIFFGDGQSQRVLQPQISHPYADAGTFTYSILVKDVEPSAPPPVVRLSVTPASVETDGLVTFKAELSRDVTNIKYRFVFADGSQTDWQDSPVTTHRYRAANTYRVYVDIGEGNGGSVRQMGGSLRQAIEVRTPQPAPINVELTANRLTVQAKDTVSFAAQSDSRDPNISYRFSFGDRSGATGWQASPRTTHVYSVAGTYSAGVDLRVLSNRSGQQTASSKPLSINVEPAQPSRRPSVDLLVIPQFVPTGLPVYFKATAFPLSSRTRYRFSFGDGTQPGAWKKTAEETHVYWRAGNYAAVVEVRGSTNGSAPRTLSARQEVAVTAGIPGPPDGPTPSPSPGGFSSPSPAGSATPVGSPKGSPTVFETTSPTADSGSKRTGSETDSPLQPGATTSPSPSPTPPTDSGKRDDWWKYLLVAALILFGGYQGWKYFYAPAPTLEPHLDPGVAALGTEGGPLSINLQMEFDPNVTDGQFSIDTTEGSLIKSERKSDG